MASETILVKVSESAKFDDSEVTPDLCREAAQFIKAYEGTFSFLVSVKQDVLARNGWRSKAQVRGVLNCMVAQIRRENSTPVQTRTSETENTVAVATRSTSNLATTVEDGYYTVVLEGGDHRTIRVRAGREDAKDTQFVSFLSGSDNERDYTCCGTVKHGLYNWTRKFGKPEGKLEAAVLTIILGTKETRSEFGRNYAIKSKNCYICNRLLTDPISIATGVGPICREKNGIEAIMPENPDSETDEEAETAILIAEVEATLDASIDRDTNTTPFHSTKRTLSRSRSRAHTTKNNKMLQATAIAGLHSVSVPQERVAAASYEEFRTKLLNA